MAYISFGVGSTKDSTIQGFVTLCRELGIKTLFSRHKPSGAYTLMGIANSHLVELLVHDEDLLHSLETQLEQKFSISRVSPTSITSLEDIQRSLFRTGDILEKNFPVECKKCERPLSTSGGFCPYCGNRVSIKLRICPKCNKVYAPAYNFCPNCKEELRETEAEVFDYRYAEDFLLGIPKEDIKL